MGKINLPKVKITEDKPSFNYRTKYTNIQEIFEAYLFFPFDREWANEVFHVCVNFLRIEKEYDDRIVQKFGMFFQEREDGEINVVGSNLLSALFLINIFPEAPHTYLATDTYETSTHIYKYNVKSKKLSIKKKKLKKDVD